jgi:pyruvate dehydrogenase E2 component (dihydrolipoamide acetyltransferase)
VAYEFKLPDLGEGLTEGEVARWLVSEGDEVAEDQPLVEIQTDKTTVEIPSPAAGKVAQILVEEGAVVPVGTILVVIGEDGAAPVAKQPSGRGRRRRRCEQPRSSGGSLRSSASISSRWTARGRRAGSPSRTSAAPPVARAREDGASRCGACAA